MKILFDHQAYTFQEYGGISRYFYELSKGLQHLNVDVINTVSLSNNVYLQDKLYNAYKFFPQSSFKGKASFIKLVNESISKTKLKGDYDVFHPTYYDTYFLKTIKNKPFVITFYDLIHEKFKNNFGELEDEELFTRRKILLEQASKVIAISNSTKNDIMDIYKIPSSKIKVVYLASSMIITDQKIDLPYKNYILYVGNRNAYKNFKIFIKSISSLFLKERDLKVICAGGGAFNSDEVNFLNENKMSERVKQVPINDDLLSALYKNALFFVFPSLYEGFGIPVLEAFSCSCATLLSNTSSLPEVGGDAALYFDPNDENDILDKVTTLIYNSDLREKLKIAGYKRQDNFSWLQTARHDQTIYKSIL